MALGRGQHFIGDPPDLVQIDSFVLMDEHVAQTGDFTPWDSGSVYANGFRNTFRRFSHNFEVAHDRVLRFGVHVKYGSADRDVVAYLLSAFQHVNQVKLWIFHRVTASARIRSRIY